MDPTTTARRKTRAALEVTVIVSGNDPGAAMERTLEKVLFLEADLDDLAACEQVITDTLRRFRTLDVLVNNAGFNDGVSLEAPPARFLESLQRNLMHVYALSHHARPALNARFMDHVPHFLIVANIGI